MWRINGDVHFEEVEAEEGENEQMRPRRLYKERINPFTNFEDEEVYKKYIFSKPVFSELLQIIGPHIGAFHTEVSHFVSLNYLLALYFMSAIHLL